MDTSGSFTLAIRLPTFNYNASEQLTPQQKNRLKSKKWAKDHPRKSKRRLKQWRIANQHRIKKWAQNYYIENKQHFKEYYEANKEHILAVQRRRRLRNNKKLVNKSKSNIGKVSIK